MGNAGDARRYRRHEDRGRVPGPAAGNVDAGSPDGPGELVDDDALALVALGLVRSPLVTVIVLDGAPGGVQRLPEGLRRGLDGLFELDGRYPEIPEGDPVQAGRVLAHRGVSPGPDVGEDRLHHLGRRLLGHRRPRQDPCEVVHTPQVESGEHRDPIVTGTLGTTGAISAPQGRARGSLHAVSLSNDGETRATARSRA